jgi:tRNA A-37 threonylcarbamoyl transferase component Bud32
MLTLGLCSPAPTDRHFFIDAAPRPLPRTERPEPSISTLWCTVSAVPRGTGGAGTSARSLSRIHRVLQHVARSIFLSSAWSVTGCRVANINVLTRAEIDFERFHSRVGTASELFRRSLDDWNRIVREAAEEEERRLREASLPNLPNGAIGAPILGLGTNARFLWLETLGNGTYAQVSKVKEVATNSVYAQKTIRVQHNNRARSIIEAQVKNEVGIMHRLRHHHIASVLFYTKDDTAFYIIMLPVAECDLRRYLEDICVGGGFQRRDIRHLDSWFGCLASALAYAHQESVKHEDIKPSNILIREHQPYLADFGSAIDFSHLDASTSPDEYVTGTPVYWPPEQLDQRGRKADVFALGCVFSEMLTVRQHQSLQEYRDARFVPHVDNGYAFRANLDGVAQWLGNLPDQAGPPGVKSLLVEQTLGMLARDPLDRPDARLLRRNLWQEVDALFCLTCG